MMKFYTDVKQYGDKIFVRGYENGKQVDFIEKYKPYLFLPKEDGVYRTLNNQPVAKMEFDSIRDARDFTKRYEEVSNFEYYGLTNYQYVFMYDYYKGEIQYDPALISVVTIDIECAADEGFPDIGKADKEITAICLRKNGKSIVFGCGEFKTDDESVTYVKCIDEATLLDKFLQVWNFKSWKPDIVTGWNIEFFDMPYLVNRIKGVLGEAETKRLSPWKILEEKEVEFKGKSNQTYTPVGIAVLDYYQLYRKFSFGNQESYKLDYIAQVEIGERKIDYSEYGNLLELYKNNFQKFIEYNIYDCALVEKLDEKLGFIQQVMALAYDAKVNYHDTMATVRPWDVIIHNYLLDRRIVIPQFKVDQTPFELIGGYVKEPKIGLSKWVVSFDLNSLYPHLIMQYNISPETIVAKITKPPSIERLLQGDYNYRHNPEVSDGAGWSWTANGCCYRKTKQGFLPALMEKMYNDRTVYKKKMIEAKQRYEKTKSKEDERLIAQYHNMQMAKKIQLNSAYGALGNRYFRWFSFANAEAITTSGQLSIRWIEKKMNEFMNKVCKTNGVDYIIASDTDSIYVTFENLIPYNCDDLEAVKTIDEFCEKKIQPYMARCYQELAIMMNAYQQKMEMKRETIANKGIWKAKKMYILNAWNVEGVQYEKPKLKIQGIEAVRSSTPHACRENIKKALSIIMNEDEQSLQEFIAQFREDFSLLPFEQVAFPRGIKGMGKYKDSGSIYKLGTPIQVKGALIFNHLLKQHNIKNIPPIMDGDKIKFAYLKNPNPIGETVIATADYLPNQFKIDDHVDRDKQFEKSFLEPLKAITDVINWKVERKITMEDFF
jgi:DNA polymerase elongation subunit (family B)